MNEVDAKTYSYDRSKLSQSGSISLGYAILAFAALAIFVVGFVGQGLKSAPVILVVIIFCGLFGFAGIWQLIGFFSCSAAMQESFVLQNDAIVWHAPEGPIVDFSIREITEVVVSLRSLPGRPNRLVTTVKAGEEELRFLEELDGYEELTGALCAGRIQEPRGTFRFRDAGKLLLISLVALIFAIGLFIPSDQGDSGTGAFIIVLLVLGILLVNSALRFMNERIEIDKEIRAYDLWGRLKIVVPFSSVTKGAFSGNDRVGLYARTYAVDTPQGRIAWNPRYSGWSLLRGYFKYVCK